MIYIFLFLQNSLSAFPLLKSHIDSENINFDIFILNKYLVLKPI